MEKKINTVLLLTTLLLMAIFNLARGQNPIFKNAFTADPSPLVHNGRLYVYVGRDEAKEGELFKMTGWLCYSTTDMKTWTDHGLIMKPTDFSWGAADSWAAQVLERDGKFFFYVTVTGKSPYGGRNVGVAVSNNPTGPFVDARGTPLIRDNMTNNGKTWDDIDIFVDDDGQPYLSWGNPLCYLVKLKLNMIEIDGAISQITPPNYAEGPWLYKRNKLYYLVYPAFVAPVGSEQICYSTATSIDGPWTYRGILTGAARNSYTIHPGIIEFKGQNYFFYHNATLTLNGLGPATGRRSVCVEYLCYNTDGTIKPITQTTAGITVASSCPPSPVVQTPFKTNPWPIPGRIEAEDYDLGGEEVAFHEANNNGNQGAANYRNDAVDIEKVQDVDGNYNISYILNSEWLEYTVNVATSDRYNLSLRVAADGPGKTMHAELDGQNITGAVTIPNTGGFQNWQTVIVPNLSLGAGKHTLRLTFDGDYFNLNYMRFDRATLTSFEDGDALSGGNTAYAQPNPFQISALLKLDKLGTIQNVTVLDLIGQTVEEVDHVQEGQQLEIGTNLSPGVYLLRISTAKGEKFQRLVKSCY